MATSVTAWTSCCLQRFWSSLAGKYGNKFYWQDNGQEAAVVNAVWSCGASCSVKCIAGFVVCCGLPHDRLSSA